MSFEFEKCYFEGCQVWAVRRQEQKSVFLRFQERLYDCTTVDLCNGRLSAITTLAHVFFEDPKLQSLLGNDLLLITGFAAEIFNLISGRRTQRVASKPLLASFHKVL